MVVRTCAAALILACALAGCFAPPGPAQLATDAARELNVATRFGRMDVAASHTAAGARKSFLERRAHWGGDLRVVDVELAGLSLQKQDEAMVFVDVSWVRMNEGSLRSTRIAQTWRDEKGWQLVREQRVAGDLGLFGEVVPAARVDTRDAHFPSKTIR